MKWFNMNKSSIRHEWTRIKLVFKQGFWVFIFCLILFVPNAISATCSEGSSNDTSIFAQENTMC